MKTKFTFGLFFFINLFFAQTLTKIFPTNANNTFAFGGHASVFQNTIVSSSILNNTPPFSSDFKIHIFDISSSIVNESQIIFSPENGQKITPTSYIFEDKLFISSDQNNTNVNNGGAVYYYKKIGTQWLYQSKIQPTNQTENDKFGSNLVFKNNQLFVTASGYEDDTLPTTSANGGIYIYNFNSDIFTLNQILTTSINTSFGRLLDIENETLVTVSGNGSNSCTIFTYKKTNQNWSLVNTFPLTVPGESPYNHDLLGSINYTNNQLFIFNCSTTFPSPLSPGEVKIYDFNSNNNWVFNSSFPFQPNDFFNAYLNVEGNNMILTAYGFYSLQMERKNPAWHYKKINGTWTFQSSYSSNSLQPNDSFSIKNYINDTKIVFCAPGERISNQLPPPSPGGLYFLDLTLSNPEYINNSLVIYPNPTENVLQIEHNYSIEIKKMNVYDIFGRNMISLDSTFENIDTSNLTTGIYLLEVTFQNNTKKTLKFIKK